MGSKINVFLLCWVISTALSSEVRVKGDSSVAFGQDASFSCSLSDPKGVSQITWQRVQKNGSIQDLATYSKMYGKNVIESNVVFKEASLNSSSITVKKVSLMDEACYVCTFHVYPSGSVRKKTCLAVHGITAVVTERLPDQRSVVFRCSATGKPAPEVTWSGASVMEHGDPQTVQNQDGTTTVSRNATVTQGSSRDRHVDCVATSLGQNVTARVNLSTSGEVPHGDNKRTHQLVAALLVSAVLVLAAVIIVLKIKREKGCVRQLISNGRRRIAQHQERMDVETFVPSEEKLPCSPECV
ncbi:OX-2 membrane glycoprotein-like [Arapaima gigas]